MDEAQGGISVADKKPEDYCDRSKCVSPQLLPPLLRKGHYCDDLNSSIRRYYVYKKIALSEFIINLKLVSYH